MGESVKEHSSLGYAAMVLWSINAVLGVLLVIFSLGVSDPIEPEDWLISLIFLVLFVIVPVVLAVVSHRANRPARAAGLLMVALLVPLLLSWIVFYA